MRKKNQNKNIVVLLLTICFCLCIACFFQDIKLYAGEIDRTAGIPVALDDGEYAIDVSLEGGSGKASVESPTLLLVENGMAYAMLTWSSAYYDYMIVDCVKYDNLSEPGMNSTFVIPIKKVDEPMQIIADTTAMGTPHEIEYALTFYSDSVAGKAELPKEQAKKVIWIAIAIIVFGGILNYFVKKEMAK